MDAVAETPSSPLSLEEKTEPGAADETEDVDMMEDRLEDRLENRLEGRLEDRLEDRLEGRLEGRLEDTLEEDSLDEEVERLNCDRLSPQSQMEDPEEDPEADPETLEPIFIAPLDGSQAELKSQIIKEVRKPGRNHESILGLLQQVKGPVDVQKYFIQHAIREAARFKKRVLIQQLETSLAELGEKQAPPPDLPNDNGSS